MDRTPKDSLNKEQHDKIRWIDTSTMLCDSLTKAGSRNFAKRLTDCMQSGDCSLIPTEESELKKMRQQKARMQKTLEKGVETPSTEFSDYSEWTDSDYFGQEFDD